MHKQFLYLVLAAVIIISIVAVTKKLKAVSKNPSMPAKTYTAAELRHYAYTSALTGKECLAKGICVAKHNNGTHYTIFLNGTGKDSVPVPVKCMLSDAAGMGFSSLEINTEMVVTGKLQFTSGMAELGNVTVISQNTVTTDSYLNKLSQ